MPAPAWPNYIGTITGIVGALTGVAGAVMGYISYRRVSKMKALDLRVELRKTKVATAEVLGQLLGLIGKAKESRVAVAVAKGTLLTGGMEVWKDQVQTDLSAVQALQVDFHRIPNDYGNLTHAALEEHLISVHTLQTKATTYADKYRAELAADDRDREHIRADVRGRH